MQTYKIASVQGTAAFEFIANLTLVLTYRRWRDKAGTHSHQHVDVVALLYHLGEVGEGRKGQNGKTAEP